MKKEMKKLITAVLTGTVLLSSALLAGCSNSASISLNGSTSMEKVIGALSEKYMADHSGVKITYDATGSGTGIEAVKNGSCDIGLASRNLKDSETGLVATVLAYDGIAVIVNEANKAENLTVDQITSIFTGEATNWKDFGGDDLEIACIGRELNSGTRDGFESVTKTEGKCKLKQELTSTGAVIEAVRSSRNAIGYVSLSAAEGQKGIKVLTVDGVACTEATVKDGTYKISRPFNLVTREGAKLSDEAQKFFDFATSSAAAELIRKAGAVPAV